MLITVYIIAQIFRDDCDDHYTDDRDDHGGVDSNVQGLHAASINSRNCNPTFQVMPMFILTMLLIIPGPGDISR